MDIRLVANLRSLNRRMTGVERYTSELTNCLGNRLRKVKPAGFLPPVAGHLWEQFILPAHIKQGELLWSPANIGPLAVRNQVLTLHDTHVLENPEWFRPLFAAWYRFLLPRLVHRVRRVLTVSEYSRQHIQETLALPGDKIGVIYAGVNLSRFQPAPAAEIERVRQRYSLPAKYGLFLGTLEPRKNLARLLQAWQQVQSHLPEVGLVVAGSPGSNFARLQPLPELPFVHFIGHVPEATLPALYSGAEAFLLPSLAEGFGLAALEAMACGTPVIASRAGALPEIIGNAGILVDPFDIQAWAGAIQNVLTDRASGLEYRRRGLDHVCRFSWQTSASKIWQELESAL